MTLGVIRIRKNLCQYSSRAPNKKLRGKFTTCKGKKLTPKGSSYKKRGRKGAARKASGSGCKKVVMNQFGNRRCMTVCRKKGKISSMKAASGCKKL